MVGDDSFDERVDELFFDELFRTLDSDDQTAQVEWEKRLHGLARKELHRAIERCCVPDARRYQAIAAAESMFKACFEKQLPGPRRPGVGGKSESRRRPAMTEPESTAGEHSLASMIHRAAAYFSHGGGVLSTGDIAQLRAWIRSCWNMPGFFKLAAALFDDNFTGFAVRTESETRWAAIVVGLAHLGDLHLPGASLGAAIGCGGLLGAALLFRLLRADGERLVDEIPSLARFLAAKGVSADFTLAAHLILSAGRSDEESTRRRLAREYYAALARANASKA